ncbi:MAG: methyl-coenzyme M reductase-associated protein Mmp3 [Candidatus Methanomethylicaceae archaeon]
MKVIIDGKSVEAHENESLKSLIKRVGMEIKEGCTIAVKRHLDIERTPTNLYEVITTKGKMILRWECDKEIEKWKQTYKGFEGCSVRWSTNDAVVFGPAKTEFIPSKEWVELRRYEMTVSLSGLSNENSHLVFSKRQHSALYFPPKDCNVLGRVVYGRHLIEFFKMGDRIIKISPVLEKKIDPRSLMRIDVDYGLREGEEVFTKMEIILDPLSPVCGEHVYNALNGGFTVSRKTSKFIADDKMSLMSIKSERTGIRYRGDVSVRNSGLNAGSVYVYLQKAPISKDHSIVGRVERGVELADVAREGDLINVVLKPERLDLLGNRQGDVGPLLEKHNIKHIRDGYASDDGIVVDHAPPTTLEIYQRREVKCKGLHRSQILRIRLDKDRAPASVKYFKKITGLDIKRVGSLEVFFWTKDVVLFKGDEVLGKAIMPENIPKESVGAGTIGITNSVKRFAGMIGIRFSESDKFGPTAESFEGTNIIGKVLENLEVLKDLKEGKKVYIMEEEHD